MKTTIFRSYQADIDFLEREGYTGNCLDVEQRACEEFNGLTQVVERLTSKGYLKAAANVQAMIDQVKEERDRWSQRLWFEPSEYYERKIRT
jgi:hypothetical protein